MTKKISVLLALLISLLSIMVIAVWTTTGESNSPIPIASLAITDYDELNEDGDKIKNIREFVNEDSLTYIVKYEIGPENADDNLLRAYADSSKVSVLIDIINSEVYVFFGNLAGLNAVTITIKDEKTNKSDEIILMFKMPGDIIVPDLD